MYGGFAAVSFAGVAGAVLFVVALLLTPWSPIFAAIIALVAGVLLLVAMTRLRGSPSGEAPAKGTLTASGQEAEREAGAVTSSPAKQRPEAPGAR
jgi:Na+/H+-dicarboxylate symporter